MAYDPSRRSSLFSALVLIFFGLFFLFHYYRGLELGHIFTRWWPLLLILWGVSKLYERMIPQPQGGTRGGFISGREIFLVLLLLAVLGIVIGTEVVGGWIGSPRGPDLVVGKSFSYNLEVAPRSAPTDAHVTIRNTRGNIHVRPGSAAEIKVSGRKNITAWTEAQASRISSRTALEIVQEGSGFEIRPSGLDTRERRIGFDLDVELPSQASLTIRSEKGDVDVSDFGGQVSVTSKSGDVELRNIGNDVSVEISHGDAKVSTVKGNVIVSGRGSEVEVINVTGSATIQGEFFSPIHAEKIAKGVRFVSHRTDLTLTQLPGRFEIRPGNFEIADSAGNLTITTNSNDLNLENIAGRVKIDNRNANVHFRLASPPKEDIEITNSSASIVVTLPPNAGFQIIADSHSGDIDSEFQAPTLKKTTTESGDSHLEGKVGSRGPKITLKTSYGSISLHKGT
jgi:DUF4097 and DUF4098 domain-containing protein YvlB